MPVADDDERSSDGFMLGSGYGMECTGEERGGAKSGWSGHNTHSLAAGREIRQQRLEAWVSLLDGLERGVLEDATKAGQPQRAVEEAEKQVEGKKSTRQDSEWCIMDVTARGGWSVGRRPLACI